MTTGEAIYAELKADTVLQALVDSRIFPGVIPQKTEMPAVCYQVVSDVPQESFTNGVDRLVNARVQIDCYAKTYLEAQAVAAAIDAVMTGLARPDLSALREISRDLYENEDQLHRVTADYSVWR